MVKKSAIWFLTVAFLNLTITHDLAGAGTISSRVHTGVAVGIEEDNGGEYKNETFDIRGSLQFTQLDDTRNVMNDASDCDSIKAQSITSDDVKTGGGISKGATIAIIVGVVLLAVVAAAAASGGASAGGLNIGFGH